MPLFFLLQMVMEFTDSVMNLATHQINSAQMKQFVEVSAVTEDLCVCTFQTCLDNIYP